MAYDPSSGGGGSPLTTKGDIYTYGSANARQAIGANGTLPVANSALTNGWSWIDPTAVNSGGSDLLLGMRKKWTRYWADPAVSAFSNMEGTLGSSAAPGSATSENPDWSTMWKSIPKALWNTTSTTLASQIQYCMTGHQVALASVVGFADAGGWYYEAFGGFAIHVATFSRMFVGLRSSSALIGNNDPSSQLNCLGFGADAADTQITFMHNDGVGTCTKDVIAGGAGYPCHTSLLDFYRFRIWAAPNQTTTVNWGITNLTNTPTVEATGTVTTDMPAAALSLVPYWWWSQGNQTGTAARVGATLMQCISNY